MAETTDPTFYRSPTAAIAAPPESLAYVAAFDPAAMMMLLPSNDTTLASANQVSMVWVSKDASSACRIAGQNTSSAISCSTNVPGTAGFCGSIFASAEDDLPPTGG